MLKNSLCIICYLPEFDGIESTIFLIFFSIRNWVTRKPKTPFFQFEKDCHKKCWFYGTISWGFCFSILWFKKLENFSKNRKKQSNSTQKTKLSKFSQIFSWIFCWKKTLTISHQPPQLIITHKLVHNSSQILIPQKLDECEVSHPHRPGFFFNWPNFDKKRNNKFKIQKWTNNFGGFQSPQVKGENKNQQVPDFYIGF